MSALETSSSESLSTDLVALLLESRWDRFEALLSRLSERLNPILVKEARQSLRSRQFVVTFFLMLVSGWVWSILGLALMGPDVAFSADGPSMFYAYHIILAFPLMVVAPYSAFQSLSAERQDRTYELVSITALNARQILSGKLCGVMLQMMIYLSAIFPCLAFTYLLRGLDIFTILLTVAYTCFMSLGAAVLGLLFATLTPPRQTRFGMGVWFFLVLGGGFVVNLSWIFTLIGTQGAMIDAAEFWQFNLCLLTFYSNGFVLAFLAARSLLTTVNQNRSTALRVALLATQLSLLGWFAWGEMTFGGNFLFGLVFFSTLLWYVAGVFMTGEPPLLSPRVKRELPQSLLGRVFLTWFAPGPGTGYMFAVANMIAVLVLVCLPYKEVAGFFRSVPSSLPPGMLVVRSSVNGRVTKNLAAPNTVTVSVGGFISIRRDVLETCIIATSYVIIYLGIGKLLLDAISRRQSEVRLATRTLVHLLLVLLGSGTPWVVQLSVPRLYNWGYTLLQISNPIWTIWECCTRGVPIVGPVLVVGLLAAALMVWVLNLPSLAAELRQVRIARPVRVAEEDAALAARTAGPPAPSSPWE